MSKGRNPENRHAHRQRDDERQPETCAALIEVWIIGDHASLKLSTSLGSTSVTANHDGTGALIQRYKPWGGRKRRFRVRYQSGTFPTKYTYTGQYSHTGDFGLMFYVARWYDPVLGRFIQPDSLVPEPGNPMAWDRYAYGLNNPIRYTDPSGHSACDGEHAAEETCTTTADEYKVYLKEQYGFLFTNEKNWTVEELEMISKVMHDIIAFVNQVAGGGGNEWVQANLSNIVFTSNKVNSGIVSGGYQTPVISLGENWLPAEESGDGADVYLAHELAHVIDNRSNAGTFRAKVCGASLCGGGASDWLARWLGGDPRGFRPFNGSSGIPSQHQWSTKVNSGYGNTGTSEYFADAFAYTMYQSGDLPSADVGIWIRTFISVQVSRLE